VWWADGLVVITRFLKCVRTAQEGSEGATRKRTRRNLCYRIRLNVYALRGNRQSFILVTASGAGEKLKGYCARHQRFARELEQEGRRLRKKFPSLTGKKIPMAFPQLQVVGIFHPMLPLSLRHIFNFSIDESGLKSVRIICRNRRCHNRPLRGATETEATKRKISN
jgi:hypothetical protein